MGLIILALYIPHRNVAKINEIRVKSYKPDKLREKSSLDSSNKISSRTMSLPTLVSNADIRMQE